MNEARWNDIMQHIDSVEYEIDNDHVEPDGTVLPELTIEYRYGAQIGEDWLPRRLLFVHVHTVHGYKPGQRCPRCSMNTLQVAPHGGLHCMGADNSGRWCDFNANYQWRVDTLLSENAGLRKYANMLDERIDKLERKIESLGFSHERKRTCNQSENLWDIRKREVQWNCHKL